MDFNYDSGIIDTVYTLDTTESPPATAVFTAPAQQNVLNVLGGAIALPTSANSVTTPANGMLRYNTGGWIEAYYSSGWNTFTTGSGVTISTVSGAGPYYILGNTATSGSLSAADVVTSVSYNASTGALSATSFTGAGTGLTGTASSLNIGGTAAVSTTSTITTSSVNSTFYPTFVSATSGNLADTVNTSLTFNPSSGLLSATTFSGSGASLTNIPNGALTNSSVTIGSTSVALGATVTAFSGLTGLTFSSGTVTGVANPVNATDVVNLQYLQNVEAGLVWKQEVQAASTSSNAFTATQSNPWLTLTNSGTQSTFTLDAGYTASVGDRVLIKNQATQTQNGIYTVTNVGSGSTNWVLTRALDADTPDGLDAATVFVVQGTTNANTAWTQTTATPTLGSSNIVFVQNYAVSGYAAGTGLTLTGNSFSITAPVTAALGGTGTTTTPTSGQVLVGTSSNAYVPYTLATGTGISTTTGSGTLQINNTGVTSNVATANQVSVSGATGAVTLSLSSTLVAPGSLQVTTSFQVSSSTGLTISSGTTQGSNAQTNDYNEYTTVGSGIAATLPAGLAGRLVTTVNRGANAITLFPASGAQIDGAGTNTAISIPAGQSYTAQAISSTQWYSITNTFAAGTNTTVSVSNGVISFSVSGTVSNATNATNVAVTNNAGASSSTWYPTFVSAGTGNLPITVDSTGEVLSYVPSTGTLSTVALTVSGLTAKSFIYSGTGGAITSTSAPTNGQLLIGNTGNAPSVAALTGTANQLTVTNSAGGITLSIPSTFVAPGSVQVTTTLQVSTTGSISAAGSTQGTGTALTTDYNVITTASAGQGVVLPAGLAGRVVTIVNTTSAAILVYPASSAAIDALGTNTPIGLLGFQTYTVEALSATQWYSVDIFPFTNMVQGTANQITATTGSPNVYGVTLSLPAAVTITTSLTISGLTANSFLYSGTAGLLTTTSAPTNGQLLIGSSGAAPVVASLGSSGNSIYVTTGAGSLSIAGPKFFAEDTSVAPVTAPSATASQSVAIGNAALASLYGQVAIASGKFSTAGDAQHSILVLRNSTTSATPTELFLDGSSIEWVLPLSSVVTFSILISAIFNSTGGSVANTYSAGFEIEGVAYVGATAATIALVGTQSLTVLGRISSTMTASVATNTSTGALKIMVTGVASTDINWVAVVQTCEVGHT